MDSSDVEFNKRLLKTFRVEAEEHIQTITSGLIELEKSPAPEKCTQLIETMFREVHSLKGAARSVNLREFEMVCQPLETVFSRVKLNQIALESGSFDLLHRVVDFLGGLVATLEEKRTPAQRSLQKELIGQLGIFSNNNSSASVSVQPEPGCKLSQDSYEEPEIEDLKLQPKGVTAGQFVRVSVAKLDSLLFQAEEMIQTKVTTQQLVMELREIKNTLASYSLSSRQWKTRQNASKTSDSNEFVNWCENHLDTLHARIDAVSHAAEQDFRVMRRIVDDHLEAMKEVLMLPAASLTETFPKIIRDLAQQQGKEIDLVISGDDIDIDRRILEELKDPFIHLMRNCTDHGIEKPGRRKELNKPAAGKVAIAFATNENRQVEISISDDGSGIDCDLIRKLAIKNGAVSSEAAEKLDSREILALVFQSGFTTSPIITDLSGRGLGLAIVSEKVEKLGGSIAIESKSDVGTTFRLLLPISLATFRGVVVRAGEQLFVIPTASVIRTLRIKPEEIQTVENRETIRHNEKILSLVHLSDVLGLPETSSSALSMITMVVLATGDSQIAFVVDEVLEELQVLVKGLGRQLSRVRNITGATILGNGRVVAVLNVPDLMKSANQFASIRKHCESEKTPKSSTKVLIAEDSITSRTLLKNILESAGFQVATAVDGADAFARLRNGAFDLVVSDVDMPRMSGFELTAKIRADKKLGELPVVLVTALESRDDRERGVDVGANAYIIKSSFDQSNLLDVIKKLI
ncbi:MAG: hybrid sensor histidine kinase/response regulator [Candidatus Riflebacteria bacterium HGW-Riflebacteria-2]|jgi:two-component system chemotaxis sensor kinase CheA|nr:MAG: hybrid sensor histidine kinase/response regulator [Candidatus Riflebacteria bacterium HGW-Riflebacteria-2]